jgi:membrane protease YdiL (CAAX protease family)
MAVSRARRPLLVCILATAAALLLANLVGLVGLAASGGLRDGVLFTRYHVVYLDGEGDERALLADARAHYPEAAIELGDFEDGRGVRLVPHEGAPGTWDIGRLAEARGFQCNRFFMGQELGSLFTEPLSARNRSVLGWLLLPAPIFFFVIGWRLRRRLVPPVVPQVGRAGEIGRGIALGVTAFAGAVLVEWLMSLLRVEASEQALVQGFLEAGGPLLYVFVPFAVVLAPLGEEIFFRGFQLAYLARERGAPVAYAVSAALFAGVHLNPGGFPIYLWFGGLFAWGYRRWSSLVVPVVAHGVANGITLTLASFG